MENDEAMVPSLTIDSVKLPVVCESDIHPHVPSERASLFHAYNSQTTEWEYLRFLHSLVEIEKPVNILETGTHIGLGTLYLCDACDRNGIGHVTTIDTNAEMLARASNDLIADGHVKRVTYINAVAEEWLGTMSVDAAGPFDFAFFDSDLTSRVRECRTAWAGGLLSPGAILVFHDTSRVRVRRDGTPDPRTRAFWNDWYEFEKEAGILNQFEFPLSRGLLVARLPGKEK